VHTVTGTDGSMTATASLTVTNEHSQTITVTTSAPASATYSTGFTVAATGGASSNPIVYSATGVCSNVGPAFTMTSGTGTCTVHYNQAGDTNYAAASQVTETTTATLASQTITFGALGSKTMGDAPFNVSATATSTLTVSFASQNLPACTVAGSTVTIVSTGTCTIRASQAGDTNYNAASNVDQSFTVTPTPMETSIPPTETPKNTPNITFGAAPNLTYLGGNFTVSASTTNTDSGDLAYSYVSGPCGIVSGATFSSSGAGTCVVQANGAETTNFNAASQTQSVTIGKANSFVTTWPSATGITYGQALSASTLTGGSASVPGSFAFTTPATIPPAGTYSASVTFTPTDVTSYNTVTGTVSVTVDKVNQATLDVVAIPSTVVYGNTSALSILGGRGTGAVTYNIGASTGCSVAGSTLSVTNAGGTCAVTATKAGDANYNAATSSPSTVTLIKAMPVITWVNPADIIYGTALSVTQFNATASAAGTFTYTPASGTILNAGNGQTLSVNFAPTDSANYNAMPSTTVTINVLKAFLTVTATGINKTYDGTTTATVTLSDNRVAGDLFTDSYTSALFLDANIGIDKTINISGITISGTGVGNYTLGNTTTSTTANILADGTTATITSTAATAQGTPGIGSVSVTNSTDPFYEFCLPSMIILALVLLALIFMFIIRRMRKSPAI